MTIDAFRRAYLADPRGSVRPPAPVEDGFASLNTKIAALDQLDFQALQRLWQDIHGSKTPARLGSEFLRRAIAFHLQEQQLGGLGRLARLRLKALERRSPRNTSAKSNLPASASVKAGTRFLREWQGETHEVQALEGGQFVYRGKAYRSLSVIARAITGTHQSGPRFFGLKDAGRKNKTPRGIDG